MQHDSKFGSPKLSKKIKELDHIVVETKAEKYNINVPIKIFLSDHGHEELQMHLYL